MSENEYANVRPKVWKGAGDCMAMTLGGELSCDLPGYHNADRNSYHYDAEYGLRFTSWHYAERASFGAAADGSVGLMQIIPHQ